MERRTIIVLGSGFAAFSFVKRIDTRIANVTIVSPRNHFLFTPLLPSTTVGTVEFRSIIEPMRDSDPSVQFIQAECISILPDKRSVVCESALDGHSFMLTYDALVIAVGASVNTHGVPGVQEHALFLKELADARDIRQRIIGSFEAAAAPGISVDERMRLLHFVVVGGGPTGVEFAAELHDFITDELAEAFPALAPSACITLLEASEHILGTFDAVLSGYVTRHFLRQRITVRTGSLVTEVAERTITLNDGASLPYGTIVWSTGTGPTPLVNEGGLPKDRQGRIVVNEFLEVEGYRGIFAAGDCAALRDSALPSTAQVAQQEGTYLARAFMSAALRRRVKPFRYRHYGMLAYVGENRAVADLATLKGRGFSTWLFWRSAYLTKLVSIKNKVLVLFDWSKALIFGRDISRF